MVTKRTATRTRSTILPMVPSKLIDIAVRDMRKALKKKWIIDMGNWYQPKAEVICSVGDDLVIEKYTVCTACAAGAVMAFSLANASQLKRTLEPDDFKANERQLRAIDDLRRGSLSGAADELELSPSIDLDFSTRQARYDVLNRLNVVIPEFNQQKPEPFFKAMEAFSAKLKKAGF